MLLFDWRPVLTLSIQSIYVFYGAPESHLLLISEEFKLAKGLIDGFNQVKVVVGERKRVGFKLSQVKKVID